MTTRNGFPDAPAGRLRFVADAGELAQDRSDPGVTVVLDPAWIPGPDSPANVVPLHQCFDDALDGRDLFSEALAVVDEWAAATGIVDLLVIEGVSYWFRVRETLWNWVHERLLWRSAFTRLGDRWGSVSIPSTETALVDVARALDLLVEIREDPAEGGSMASVSSRRTAPITTVSGTVRAATPEPIRRALRRIRPRPESPIVAERRERDAELERRWERLPALPGPRVLVLTLPSSYQRLGGDERSTLRDPNLGPVVDALREGGLEPVILGWGMTHPHDDDRLLLEGDGRLLPAYLVYGRLDDPGDDPLATAAVEALLARIDAMPPVALDADRVDLGPAFVRILRTAVQRVVAIDVRELPKAERFVDLIKPVAIVMTQEHHRTPWLLAGARAAVPTFALQHGILYRTHPGYPPIRAATVVLPSRTFVHGEFARRALLAGAYEPGEVVVSGSPRLDDHAARDAGRVADAAQAAGRQAIRDRLGVRPTDRLLVVSTVNLPYVRRTHVLHMIVRLLGGPLPGIHVVFKQHPGERDEWPYRELVVGLARAGGYEPPSTTVVREIDLYELLRAADAHLGLHSTVLTDAVAAGTPNLIAIVEGRADMLGYVDAGVAVPVREVSDVRAAMSNLPVPDPGARRAFLDDHFRPGDASARIVEVIRAMAG